MLGMLGVRGRVGLRSLRVRQGLNIREIKNFRHKELIGIQGGFSIKEDLNKTHVRIGDMRAHLLKLRWEKSPIVKALLHNNFETVSTLLSAVSGQDLTVSFTLGRLEFQGDILDLALYMQEHIRFFCGSSGVVPFSTSKNLHHCIEELKEKMESNPVNPSNNVFHHLSLVRIEKQRKNEEISKRQGLLSQVRTKDLEGVKYLLSLKDVLSDAKNLQGALEAANALKVSHTDGDMVAIDHNKIAEITQLLVEKAPEDILKRFYKEKKEFMTISMKKAIVRKLIKDDDDIPSSDICSVTQDIMFDPVTDPTTETPGIVNYEREAIETWLLRKSVSPITGKELMVSQLVPNESLRVEILKYVDERMEAIINGTVAE